MLCVFIVCFVQDIFLGSLGVALGRSISRSHTATKPSETQSIIPRDLWALIYSFLSLREHCGTLFLVNRTMKQVLLASPRAWAPPTSAFEQRWTCIPEPLLDALWRVHFPDRVSVECAPEYLLSVRLSHGQLTMQVQVKSSVPVFKFAHALSRQLWAESKTLHLRLSTDVVHLCQPPPNRFIHMFFGQQLNNAALSPFDLISVATHDGATLFACCSRGYWARFLDPGEPEVDRPPWDKSLRDQSIRVAARKKRDAKLELLLGNDILWKCMDSDLINPNSKLILVKRVKRIR